MRRGFTLIELIVVIAIIAILAAIIAPNAFKAIEKAKIARVIAEVKVVKTAALSYNADTGQWPPDFDSIGPARLVNSFLDDDDGTGNPVPGWDGPYVEKWNPHPWGGHLSWQCLENFAWWDNKSGCWVYLNDDRPWTGPVSDDNNGKVPVAVMFRIDEMVDGGDINGNGLLDEGNVREPTAAGELSFLLAEF
ncbi:MAG: prepilin-type N-terminal cleavage/methylation domain-containing protein [Candidatus Omnitrophota bacterium]